MKILVPIKRVVDHNVNVSVKNDGTGVDIDNLKMSMNPFDEIAVEESVLLKESKKCDEIIAVSIGPSQCEDTLRTALAMGVDRAILVKTNVSLESLAVAKILAKIVEENKIDLVILGKQSIDNDNNQTGQMLSALTGRSQGTFASNIKINDNKIYVTREIDGGLETILITLPSVITVDLRLNKPRYVSLPNIIKAKRKPIDKTLAKDYGVDLTIRHKIISITEPEKRKGDVKIVNSMELVKELKKIGVI